ncbi:MAG TPA: hypothetical protein VFV58_39320 [Blastocatellia bacterium]|jgi:hypothetical protein|nr:hypothetical protein [Blastocatellia bacterium]
MDEQQENIERVSERIGGAVKAFMRERCGQQFFADDLRRYVRVNVGEVAPGSPDRILRMLRRAGELDYKVVSRSESLYEALWVDHPPEGDGFALTPWEG